MELWMSADLFGNTAPPISGLNVKLDAVTPVEERDLIEGIEQLNLPHFQFQAWLSKRRTRSFGWLYDFQDASFGPTDPIPAFLQSLKGIAARFAGVPIEDLVQVSLIKYETGAGIGWHKDRPELDAVIGVSLGAAATMRFRRRSGGRFERSSVVLPPRSIYLLDGEVRYEWEHSIPSVTAPRWSVTFRGLSEKGKRRVGAESSNSAQTQ
jgi:alkylated DNA repair protein (DNA oxidative demethylase)